MAEPLDTNDDYRLWVLLLQNRDLIFNIRERQLSQYGITVEQAAVLFIVNQVGDGITVGEIAWWILHKPHSVSGIIKRMERSGLVIRTRDAKRQSVVRISLTEAGRRAYRNTREIESIQAIFAALSDEEKSNLTSYLEKLRSRALGDKDSTAPPITP